MLEYTGRLKRVQNDLQATFELDSIFDHAHAKIVSDDVIRANITILDDRCITDDQRKYIFALNRDFCEYTGYPVEYGIELLKQLYAVSTSRDEISLKRNVMSQLDAGNMIEFIIEWFFENEIPFQHQEYYVGSEHTRVLFLYIKYRRCFVSGAEHSDVHHVTAIGTGNNRKKVKHGGRYYMCLSRKYHTICHTLGLHEFCKRYKVVPIKLSSDQVIEFGISTEKQERSTKR